MASPYSIHHFLMVATIFFSLCLFYPMQAEGHGQGQAALSGQALVQRVCGDAAVFKYREFCFKVLSNRQAASAPNALGLANVIFKLAAVEAEASREKIQSLIGHGSYTGKGEIFARKSLNVFGMAADTFQGTEQLLTTKNNAIEIAKYLGIIASKIENSLKTSPIPLPEVSAAYQNLKRYSVIASAVLRLSASN